MRSATAISAPSSDAAEFLAREHRHVLLGGALPAGALLQNREVELADRVLDQPAVIFARQHLPRHLARRLKRKVCDLGADLLEGAPGLGLDLLRRLFETALPVGLELVAEPLPLRLAHP